MVRSVPRNLRKCSFCKDPFPKDGGVRTPLNWFCTVKCAIAKAHKVQKRKMEVKRTKKTKELKEKYKTKSEYAKEAQTAFNSYIRARDAHLPCVSCGTTTGKWNASHYRSVGACTQLRYNCWNCHKSCTKCNMWQSGNILEYRIRLVKKIGAARVNWLESQNEVTRYSIEYLKRIKKIFAKRAKMVLDRALE